jgi:membrane associated rhomboid family serine protease
MKFKFYAFKLSGIIILFFLAQVLIPGFTELFIDNESSFVQPWRFVSSIFLHGGLAHLVLNLFALLMFGSILEKLVGGRRFLTIFFVTGIFANLVSSPFYSSSLGASGAIFGVIGALIFVRPMMPIWAFGMPMPMFVAGIFWGIADILGTYGFLVGNPINNTGNIAHLSGMFFGFIFGYFYRRNMKKRKKNLKIILDEKYMRDWENYYFK